MTMSKLNYCSKIKCIIVKKSKFLSVLIITKRNVSPILFLVCAKLHIFTAKRR